MFELDSAGGRWATLLRAGGWTVLTGINLMLFSLLHNPCSTTIYTIYKETGSARWTAARHAPAARARLCRDLLVTQVWRLLS